jgi:hypothetical protein
MVRFIKKLNLALLLGHPIQKTDKTSQDNHQNGYLIKYESSDQNMG